ncbi:MAG: TolC family protein [Bacteroides sp.]|nr:TolC family protein [Bacteroides sp.]
MNRVKTLICTAAVMMLPLYMSGQETLTLDQCREMAIKNNKALDQARTKVEMAGYDRKIARANYYPNISATGAYMYNQKSIALINDELSGKLTGTGTALHQQFTTKMTEILEGLAQLPGGPELIQDPKVQALIGALSKGDISNAITALGTELDDLLHPDTHNMFLGAVSLQQPVFMGGKIVNANRMAKLAEELSRSQYDQEYQELLITVDQAYWQVVSISNKKKLAENFADLLEKMEHDVNISVKEGVATESDALAIKVKANEANMMKTKATNGLVLAKMLLCKEVGIDLDTDITLADESLDAVPVPQMSPEKDLESIYQDRPETRSLDLAAAIYDKKMKIARADMMPKIALTANYMLTNPNLYNGFEKKFGGMFNVGVAINVPIFHGFEALQKTRKAKAEATLYVSKLDEAKELINLQVKQLRKQLDEALEKVEMAENNLKSAEENLRKASVGFEAGVVTTNTALAAHTAWLQAHSEFIDAGIELQITNANLQKAEGNYKSDID